MIICFSSLDDDEVAAAINAGGRHAPYLAEIFGGMYASVCSRIPDRILWLFDSRIWIHLLLFLDPQGHGKYLTEATLNVFVVTVDDDVNNDDD